MGLYIPKEPMPKYCAACKLCTIKVKDELKLMPDIDARCALGVDLNGVSRAALYSGRRKECPLQEVVVMCGCLVDKDKMEPVIEEK